MASFCEYLLSSLPMLLFGAKPPFTHEEFFDRCRDLIPAKDFSLLQLCAQTEVLEQEVVQPTLKSWVIFERSLRNELVRLRASRKKADPEKFLRDGTNEPALYHVALASHRVPSLIESEKMLDRERWLKLEELALGHYFDLDALIVYGLKLQILLRWKKIDTASPAGLLEALGV
jgi:hypothetical protein